MLMDITVTFVFIDPDLMGPGWNPSAFHGGVQYPHPPN